MQTLCIFFKSGFNLSQTDCVAPYNANYGTSLVLPFLVTDGHEVFLLITLLYVILINTVNVFHPVCRSLT